MSWHIKNAEPTPTTPTAGIKIWLAVDGYYYRIDSGGNIDRLDNTSQLLTQRWNSTGGYTDPTVQPYAAGYGSQINDPAGNIMLSSAWLADNRMWVEPIRPRGQDITITELMISTATTSSGGPQSEQVRLALYEMLRMDDGGAAGDPSADDLQGWLPGYLITDFGYADLDLTTTGAKGWTSMATTLLASRQYFWAIGCDQSAATVTCQTSNRTVWTPWDNTGSWTSTKRQHYYVTQDITAGFPAKAEIATGLSWQEQQIAIKVRY